MKRIAIVGSRIGTAWQADQVDRAICAVDSTTVIVTGDASGVDSFARTLAQGRRRRLIVCHAANRGAVALKARNAMIAELADECIAFPDAQSKGTWDTVRRFKSLGKPVRVLREGEL